MKSKTEAITGPPETPLFAPRALQVYTAVSHCERMLLSGEIQSDEDDEGQDPLPLDFAALFAMMPSPSNSTRKFANAWIPDAIDYDVEEEDSIPPQSIDYALAESIIMCMRGIYRARDYEDFGTAILHFLKAYTGKSVCAMLHQVVAKVTAIFKQPCSGLQSEEDENPFSKLRDLMAKATALTQHPLLTKLKRVMWYLLSFGALSKLGISFDTFFYSKAEEEALSKQCSSTGGFLFTIFDGFVSLFERLLDCYRTGSWSPLLVSGTSYSKWSDSVYELKVKSQQLHNPDACGFSYHSFLGDLESALEQGRAIVKYETDKSVANGMKKLLSELEMIKATECTKKAARASRDAPFALLYYGGSSLAKTTLQDLTHSHFAKTHDLPEGDEYKYTRTCSDEYYSGFMTQMWSFVVDDIANLNPNLGLDPSMSDFLHLRGNAPFCPPQADLVDKGKTPVLIELLQASTNTKDLNAHAYYNNTLAIMRRWNFIVTITLKAEYAQTVGGSIPEPSMRMLDGSKAHVPAEGEYPDMWNFLVEKVVAASDPSSKKQHAAFEPVLSTSSIYEYLAFVSRESSIFRAQQAQIKSGAKKYQKVNLCKMCFFPENKCSCTGSLQSREGTQMVAFGALASAMSLYCVGPAVKRGTLNVLDTVRNRVVTTGTDVATEIARNAATNLIREAKKKAAPHVIDVLRREGFLSPAEVDLSVEFDGVRDEEEQALLNRLTALNMPEAPQMGWYEKIKLHVQTLPISQRLVAEKRWVGAMMAKFGRRIQRIHRRTLLNPILGTAYAALIGTLMSVATVMSMTLVLRWMFPQKKKAKKTGKTQGDDESETFEQDDKPNPWYRDEYKPSRFDYTPLTVSWKDTPREVVEKRVQRNVMYVRSSYVREGKVKERVFRILCLEGQLFVTNSHNIPVDDVTFQVTQSDTQPGVGENFRVTMHTGDFYRDGEHDLVFFRLRCIPPRASISGLLVSKNFTTVCEASLLSRDALGVPEKYRIRALANSVETSDEIPEIVAYRGECEIITQSGQCGAPYLGFPPLGPVLLGLHIIGGWTNSVACVVLPKESFERARDHLKAEVIQAGVPDLRDAQGKPIELLPLHRKSTFRYIENGTASVYGSLPGFRAAGKSKVTKTVIHDAMLEVGYEVKVGAPVLNSWKPWRLGCVDIVQQEHTINCPVLDECVDAFVTDILRELPAGALDDVKVISERAALNGLPGVKYIDRMNLSSSMGHPWNSPKNNYLVHHGPVDKWDDLVDFTPEIHARVDAMHERYRRGERCMAIFRMHQKDEVISLAKVEAQKTRLFSGGNFPLALLMRQYFLGLVRCIQKNKFVFEAAPGTNATSLEWCQFYHWLTRFGKDRIIAGDYSKFDKRMSPAVLLAAFKVLEEIMIAAGYTDEQMITVRAMKWDVIFALTDCNGDLVQFWGSNPSGHILTVIINCIANSLYVRYAWRLSGHELTDFRKFVALMTYGDDNVMGVSEEVVGFDHCVIQAKLAEIGVVYTMPDKESESVPFVNIEDVSFLKRAWVYNQDVGSYVAQLEHGSIEKGLLYHIPSSTVCSEKLAVDSMDGALREYFYYGRDRFEERKAVFERVIREGGLTPYFMGFPSYDELVQRYLKNSEDYSLDGRCERCAA